MANKKLVVSFLSVLVLVEYALGGLVSFDDTSDKGFQLTSHVLTWPAVLPFAHRFFCRGLGDSMADRFQLSTRFKKF